MTLNPWMVGIRQMVSPPATRVFRDLTPPRLVGGSSRVELDVAACGPAAWQMSELTAECTDPDGADVRRIEIAVFFPLDSNAWEMVRASGAPGRLHSLS